MICKYLINRLFCLNTFAFHLFFHSFRGNEMKMGIGVGFFLRFSFLFIFSFIFINSFGQQIPQGVENFFSKAVIPSTWYDAMNVTPSAYRNLYRFQEKSEPFSINQRYYYHPNRVNYYSNDIQKMIIRSGMINNVIEKEMFQPYLIKFNILPKTYFTPISLPVLIKAYHVDLQPEKPDFLKDKRPPNENLPHSKTMKNAIHFFQERPHKYENLVKSISRDYPWLIDNLWIEVPDIPDYTSINQVIKQKRVVEMLNEEYSHKTPELPKKLNKIEPKKPNWKYSGSEHLTYAQTYINNWVQGGESSQSLQSDLNIKASYSEDNTQWHNEIRHKLGLLSYKIKDESTGKEKNDTRINEDLLEFHSQYGYKASKKWNYGLLLKLRTQIFNGYAAGDTEKKEPKSAFLSPGYLTLAAGMNYKTGKKNSFSVLIAPVTGEVTMVLDTVKINQTQYSIDPSRKAKFDLGASLTNSFSWQIINDVKLTTSGYLFYDYIQKENKIKCYQEIILDLRINVFLSARVTVNFRYFQNELDKLQTKENMGISFRYIF